MRQHRVVMSQKSAFVVNVTGPGTEVGWLSEVGPGGHRTISPKPAAARFATRKAAHKAIATMPTIPERADLIFSVERAE
jgi:hypothetical protein